MVTLPAMIEANPEDRKMTNTLDAPERMIDLDLVRCTENAALSGWKWFGKGDKNKADFAATDAIRGMFQEINCKGDRKSVV